MVVIDTAGIDYIDQVLGKLKESADSPSPAHAGHNQLSAEALRRVFVVHGHDEAMKEAVARFIEKLGLEAVVLAEKTNEGRTIIEKFEAHAEEAGFAVVLLSDDDVGATKADRDLLRPRARQNVILELGYFIGALGELRCVHSAKETSNFRRTSWALSTCRGTRGRGGNLPLPRR